MSLGTILNVTGFLLEAFILVGPLLLVMAWLFFTIHCKWDLRSITMILGIIYLQVFLSTKPLLFGTAMIPLRLQEPWLEFAVYFGIVLLAVGLYCFLMSLPRKQR